jgi:hypothetical protein
VSSCSKDRNKAIEVIRAEINAATMPDDNPLDHCRAGSQVERDFRALVAAYQQLIKLLESNRPDLCMLDRRTVEGFLARSYADLAIIIFRGGESPKEMNGDFKAALYTLGKHLRSGRKRKA